MRTLLLVVVTCLLVSASMTVVEGLIPECEELTRMIKGGFSLTPAEAKFFTDRCGPPLTPEQQRSVDEVFRKAKGIICTWSTSTSCVRCLAPSWLFDDDNPKTKCPGTYEIFPNLQAAYGWYHANCCK